MKYRIRFNKSRGQPGRGGMDHVWRVFQGNTEWLAKHVIFKFLLEVNKKAQIGI